MSGLLNQAFPALDALDGALAFLPAAVRVALLGALSGALAMALYWLLSPQAKIKARKVEIQDLRRQLQAAKDDLALTLRLSRRNLAASFALLGATLLPALLSSLPLLAVIAWLASRYAYELPAAGTPVPVAIEPAADGIAVAPPLLPSPGGMALAWPAAGAEPVRFSDAQGLVYAGPPAEVAASLVHKPRWWNRLLGNEAGYLRADAPIEAIRFDLRARRLLPGLPGWLAGWEAVYFAALIAASLLIKVRFKIA